jgi:EpsI family protein
LLSSWLGEQILWVVGLEVVRVGTVLTVPHFTLQVGAPCNGLNLLTGLLMLGAFHAIVSKMRLLPGLLTVAACLPAAVLANALRIGAIAAVGSWWDADLALRWFHDYSGFVSLVLAMGVVVTLGKLFERLPVPVFLADLATEKPSRGHGGASYLVHFCVLLAMTAIPDWAIARGRQTIAPPALAAFPAKVGGMVSVAEELTAEERNLEATTGGEIKRRAYSKGVQTVWVALVTTGASWRVHHPPEFCYAAQGWTVLDNRLRQARGSESYRELLVEKDGDRRVVQYWFTDGQRTTASALSRWLAALESGFQGRRRYPWLLVIQSSRAHDVSLLDQFRESLRQAALGWLTAWPERGAP